MEVGESLSVAGNPLKILRPGPIFRNCFLRLGIEKVIYPLWGIFIYQVGLRNRRRGHLIHSVLIPATLAGNMQGEPKPHNGHMPTQLGPKKAWLCKN